MSRPFPRPIGAAEDIIRRLSDQYRRAIQSADSEAEVFELRQWLSEFEANAAMFIKLMDQALPDPNARDFANKCFASLVSASHFLGSRGLDFHNRRQKSFKGKAAANLRHDQEGGYRQKKTELLRAWGSGIYGTKKLCAEVEARRLGLSFDTARRHLRNAPPPQPLKAP